MNPTKILATIAIAASALLGSTATNQTADAAIVQSAAKIMCTGGTVRAYVPSEMHTKSSNAHSTLMVAHVLYKWNGSGWSNVSTSPWWAYTTTNAEGYAGQISPYGKWLTMQNSIAGFHPFQVTAGYYAVVTYIYDTSDSTMSSVLNRQSVSDAGSSFYCQV